MKQDQSPDLLVLLKALCLLLHKRAKASMRERVLATFTTSVLLIPVSEKPNILDPGHRRSNYDFPLPLVFSRQLRYYQYSSPYTVSTLDHWVLGFCISRFDHLRWKITGEKNCIYTEHVDFFFFLTLFPKEYIITTIYTTFTLY